MSTDQRPSANPDDRTTETPPVRSDDPGRLGREKPGEGLDTGVDTGAIQPGQSGNNGKLN